MTYFVGLVGPGKVGKSTTSKNIKECLRQKGLSVESFAYADILYEVCSLVTGLPVSYLKDTLTKEQLWNEETSPLPCLIGWYPRKLLQVVGTECFREHIHQEFWIQSTFKKAEKFDIAIIEDARFDNEQKALDINIELERDGIEYLKNHSSAMPPNAENIFMKIKLHKDIKYNEIADTIYNKYLERTNAL